MTLQRLFTTFPSGWPGVGLLLLRTAAGATAAIQGVLFWRDAAGTTLSADLIGLLSLLGGAALMAGFVTPLAGGVVGLAVLGMATSWLPRPTPDLFDAPVAAMLAVVVATAVMFLGPGALSLDARLFGRREIIIPHAKRPPQS